VCFHARPVSGHPHPDLHETIDAGWFALPELTALVLEPAVGGWIDRLRSGPAEPHFD
jgi:hypothetical protein